MRPLITSVDLPGVIGYRTPDGLLHNSIAAAVRHHRGRRPSRTMPQPVQPPIVAPAAVARPAVPYRLAVPTRPDPFAALMDLKRQLRHAQAELDACMVLPAAPGSAASRWNTANRSRYASRANRLKRAVAAHRQRYGIPEPRVWKPRPAHAADRRMGRQYRSDQTPIGWELPRRTDVPVVTAEQVSAAYERTRYQPNR